MDITDLRDGIATWFGGPYDLATRSYRAPEVPGLGTVKRAPTKDENDADYFLNGADRSGAGSMMYVWAHDEVESRAAMAGPFDGLKLVKTSVELEVHLRSYAPLAEDAVDAFYQLHRDLKARLRADRCMGSGGFELGGFVVGEGGSPWLRSRMSRPSVTDEVTYGFLNLWFDATYYERG
jgi:hypothetical protein